MSKVARAIVANVCLEEPSSKRARLPIPLCCDETITSLPGRAASQDCSDAVVAKGDLSDDSDWCKWKAEILTEEDLEAMLEDTDGPPSRIHGQADGPTDFSHLFNHGAGAAARGHGDVDEGDVADDNALDDDLEAMLEDTDVEVNHTLSIMLEDGCDNDKSTDTVPAMMMMMPEQPSRAAETLEAETLEQMMEDETQTLGRF